MYALLCHSDIEIYGCLDTGMMPVSEWSPHRHKFWILIDDNHQSLWHVVCVSILTSVDLPYLWKYIHCVFYSPTWCLWLSSLGVTVISSTSFLMPPRSMSLALVKAISLPHSFPNSTEFKYWTIYNLFFFIVGLVTLHKENWHMNDLITSLFIKLNSFRPSWSDSNHRQNNLW